MPWLLASHQRVLQKCMLQERTQWRQEKIREVLWFPTKNIPQVPSLCISIAINLFPSCTFFLLLCICFTVSCTSEKVYFTLTKTSILVCIIKMVISSPFPSSKCINTRSIPWRWSLLHLGRAAEQQGTPVGAIPQRPSSVKCSTVGILCRNILWEKNRILEHIKQDLCDVISDWFQIGRVLKNGGTWGWLAEKGMNSGFWPTTR